MTAKKVLAKKVKKISNGSKITIEGCDNPKLPEPEMFESPESSTIMAGTYRYTTPDMGRLTVLFRDHNRTLGRLYEFTPDMPLDQWQQFRAASSKGEHFHQNIRPAYKGVRVA